MIAELVAFNTAFGVVKQFIGNACFIIIYAVVK